MEEYLIVDGYNIIHAWPELEKLYRSSVEHARARLVDILVNYAALSGERVVVVFDAHRLKSKGHAEKASGVEVIYTPEGITADEVIEQLAGELAHRGVVYVATGDWMEQRVILGRGAYRLTARELQERVERAVQESRRFYSTSRPADRYLENRLEETIKNIFERWRKDGH